MVSKTFALKMAPVEAVDLHMCSRFARPRCRALGVRVVNGEMVGAFSRALVFGQFEPG